MGSLWYGELRTIQAVWDDKSAVSFIYFSKIHKHRISLALTLVYKRENKEKYFRTLFVKIITVLLCVEEILVLSVELVGPVQINGNTVPCTLNICLVLWSCSIMTISITLLTLTGWNESSLQHNNVWKLTNRFAYNRNLVNPE